MKKILIFLGIITDVILWYVGLSLVSFSLIGMIVAILELTGILKSEPSIVVGNWGLGVSLLIFLVSIWGVVNAKFPGCFNRKNKVKQGLCSFEIVQPVKGFAFSKPRSQEIFIFQDKLVISGEKGVEIKIDDITSIWFLTGEIHLEYGDKSISFIFPSYVANVSEGTTTELFIAIVRGLMKNEDVSEFITLISDAKMALDKKLNLIVGLIKSACIIFVLSFFVIVGVHEGFGFLLLLLALGCLAVLFPVSIIFSKGDYSFGNKLVKLPIFFCWPTNVWKLLKIRKVILEKK